jgi:hypothetical protein
MIEQSKAGEGAAVSQSGHIYYTLIWQVLGFAGPSFYSAEQNFSKKKC